METKVKRREWVKTVAIIFLAVMLVLMFFSNTIMNRSLPEVAAQYVEAGSINARIRGSGTVSANEVYDVTLSQTRKIRSVPVKVGQQVQAGDVLFQLESMDSDELKAARDTLEQMERSYQKSLIEESNSSSTEDRQIQKLREDYDKALRVYQIYSGVDPDQIEVTLHEAESELARLKNDKSRIDADLQRAQAELTKAKTEEANYLARLEELKTQIDELELKLDSILSAETVLKNDVEMHRNAYEKLEDFAGSAEQMKFYAENQSALVAAGVPRYEAEAQAVAYDVIITDLEALRNCLDKSMSVENITDLDMILTAVSNTVASETTVTEQNLRLACSEVDTINASISAANPHSASAWEAEVDAIQRVLDRFIASIAEQQSIVNDYTQASSAATTLKAAEEALEDALFQASLGDSGSLDIQAAREDIEEQKRLVDELALEADGQDVTAPVTGTISAINITAGNTAGAEQVIAQITVADRGYTINIPVTNEQARQVRIGDTAQITNYYWGDITATLENIANDPQTMGQGKRLIFRISGEGVEAGTNLTLSIGQKSANYDCLIPNSAIRSDANGSFVLVVTAKSSPLGNRYMATRADIQVLAADDTTSAVSGLANGDFVITTSTKPLEAGDLVRLPDDG